MADVDMLDPAECRNIQETPTHIAVAQDLLTWAVPTAALTAIGAVLGAHSHLSIGAALLLDGIWSGAFIGFGIITVVEQNTIAYERFGRFHKVKFPGLRWHNWILDREREQVGLDAFGIPLYNDPNELIDFKDGSTPIKAKLWCSVGNPVDVSNRNYKALTRQISLWIYRYRDRVDRVMKVCDGVLRPLLQAEDIDEAQIISDKVGDRAANEARSALAGLGIYPVREKALIIEDIVLPPELVALRTKRLQGQTDLEEATLALQAPSRAIDVLIAAAAERGEELSFDRAHQMVLEKLGLDMLSKTGSNISLVGRGMGDILSTLEIGRKA